jgi:hypothetical protein
METCPSINERFLMVVNVVNTDLYDSKILLDYQHCRPISESEIQVNITYFELGLSLKNKETNDKAFFSKLPKFILEYEELLQDKCNELLIRIAISSFSYLNQILNSFKMFPIKKTLILKMYPEPDVKNFKSDFNLSKVYVNPYVNLYREISGQSNRLTCQPWFRFFLAKAFDCTKGRLLQYTGTCYINSVINMVILSPILKLFVIKAMNEYARKNSQIIPEIIRTLEDVTACPLVSETTTTLRTVYILRAVYSILCKKIKPKHGADLLFEASKRYFSANTTHFFRPSLKEKRKFEGFSHFAMYSFLYDVGINFAVKDPYVGQEMFYLPRKLKESEIQIIRKGNFDTFTTFDKILETDPKFDILFYIVPELELEEIEGYLPECVNITLALESGMYHSVCGIRCENGYKVIDSNDAIYDFDWRMFYIEDNKYEFCRQVKLKYNDPVISVSFEFCIYVHQDNGLKLSSEDVTCHV